MKKVVYLTIFMALLFSSCGNESKQETTTNKSDVPDSQIIAEYNTLYKELQGFKNNNDFREMGFAPNGPYKDWYDRVIELIDKDSKDFILKHGLGAKDLLDLGLEYVKSTGADNDKTEWFTKRFELLFNPKNLEDGKPVENEISAQGSSLGKWQVKNKNFPNDNGFTIEIMKIADTYISIESGKQKKLNKVGEKYYVVGDVDNTYYMIRNGNLRFCSSDGDFTDAAGWEITPVK